MIGWEYVKAFALPVAIALFLAAAVFMPLIDRLIPDTVGYETREDLSSGTNALY